MPALALPLLRRYLRHNLAEQRMTPSDLSTLSHRLIEAARAAGADAADSMAVQGTSVSVDVRAGALEHAERSEGIDVGLRVFVGKKQANVSSSDTSDRTIQEMAIRAVAMANEAPDDPYAGLADPADLLSQLGQLGVDRIPGEAAEVP